MSEKELADNLVKFQDSFVYLEKSVLGTSGKPIKTTQNNYGIVTKGLLQRLITVVEKSHIDKNEITRIVKKIQNIISEVPDLQGNPEITNIIFHTVLVPISNGIMKKLLKPNLPTKYVRNPDAINGFQDPPIPPIRKVRKPNVTGPVSGGRRY